MNVQEIIKDTPIEALEPVWTEIESCAEMHCRGNAEATEFKRKLLGNFLYDYRWDGSGWLKQDKEGNWHQEAGIGKLVLISWMKRT